MQQKEPRHPKAAGRETSGDVKPKHAGNGGESLVLARSDSSRPGSVSNLHWWDIHHPVVGFPPRRLQQVRPGNRKPDDCLGWRLAFRAATGLVGQSTIRMAASTMWVVLASCHTGHVRLKQRLWRAHRLTKGRAMTWTHFWDMHSGGGQKLEWAHIFMEAPADEARSVFYSRFGRNPERVTCTCCGDDYSISEYDSLGQATGYQRNLPSLMTPRDPETGRYVHPDDPWFRSHYYLEPHEVAEARQRGWEVGDSTTVRLGHGAPLSVEQYAERDDVLIIHADEIADRERTAELPAEGYVWAGE